MRSSDDATVDPPDHQPPVVASSRPVGAGVHVLVVVDEIDMATAPQLHAAAARALRGRPRVLAVDLAGVGFMASRGLHTLLRVHREAAVAGCLVVLVAVPHPVARVIELMGLDGVLVQHDTLDAVLAAEDREQDAE
ncbi:MAG: STAS domain-containing protein [Pseudonocardia sp.]